MALEFQIISGSPFPIYRQILDQIRKAVAEGQLRDGDQLPSVRTLAEHLLINPNTVARAYTELTRAGLIESQPGRGFFLTRRRSLFSDAERSRRFDAALEQFVLEALFLDYGRERILSEVRQRLDQLPRSKP